MAATDNCLIMRTSVLERLKTKYLVLENGCWKWQSGVGDQGYGKFWMNGKNIDPHRASYILHKGPIPPKMLVCHSCDNKWCVNPDHFFLGTHKKNSEDMVKKNRAVGNPLGGKVGQKQLRNNHPGLTAYKNGCRCEDCKKLYRDYMSAYYRRKKAASLKTKCINHKTGKNISSAGIEQMVELVDTPARNWRKR